MQKAGHWFGIFRRYIRRAAGWNAMLRWFLPRYRLLAVRRDTDLVIEGYPRCANTFSVVAFEMSQTVPCQIAHHLHSVGQVRRAASFCIPCLVLIRNPKDAALSLAVRKQWQQIAPALVEYIDFYSGIKKWSDSIVLADFSEVTNDFGTVTDRLNQRFETNFDRFTHTPENVEACYDRIDKIEQRDSQGGQVRSTHVARPTPKRVQLSEALEEDLLREGNAALLDRANAIYQELLVSRDEMSSQLLS